MIRAVESGRIRNIDTNNVCICGQQIYIKTFEESLTRTSLRNHSGENGSCAINSLRATTVTCHSSGRMLLAYANRHWLLAFRRNGSDSSAMAGNLESAFISIAIIYHHKFRRVRGDSVTFLRHRGTHYSRMARNSVKRIVNFLEYLELVVWHVGSKRWRDIEKGLYCYAMYDND